MKSCWFSAMVTHTNMLRQPIKTTIVCTLESPIVRNRK